MTDMRKVWPKEPLTAERENNEARPWGVDLPGGSFIAFTDSEFAASFVDAAVLSELVDAARIAIGAYFGLEGFADTYEFGSLEDLRAALAAFDAAMRPDGETQ